MILDSITSAELYYNLGPNIKTGLKFLKDTATLEQLPLGRLEIDGDKVFALVQEYETRAFNKEMWEAHKKYYDIQFIVSGEEKIMFARIENCKPRTEFNISEDFWLFSAEGDEIGINEGYFMILGPEDVHQPGIHKGRIPQKVRKIVVKAMI